MKNKLLFMGVLLTGLVVAGVVYSQSTANQILLGYLTTSGCPGGASSCWMPYTSVNPLPVVSQ